MSHRTPIVRSSIALFLVCSLLSCRAAPTDETEEFTTVVLVRHAEKELTGDDPDLTDQGVERAAALAHVLGEMDVAAVYATQYVRTRATALPVANALGLEVSVVAAAGSGYAAEMADIVRTHHRGETVVVVSHSNTVPAIIGEFGASPTPMIDADEYDDLYIVVMSSTGGVALLPLRYGAATP